MKEYFNLDFNELYKYNRKEKADLVYDVREYVKVNGFLPWKKINGKYQRIDDFPHSLGLYAAKWGSITKAWLYCGIKKTRIQNSYNQYQWEVIG